MIEKMRKNILSSVAIAAVAALSLASCNKSQPQVEAKSESKAPAELKIAYVEVDSIMTQYTFAKEYSSILEKKGQNIQATIAQKGRPAAYLNRVLAADWLCRHKWQQYILQDRYL